MRLILYHVFILNYAVKISLLEGCNLVPRHSRSHLHFASVNVALKPRITDERSTEAVRRWPISEMACAESDAAGFHAR